MSAVYSKWYLYGGLICRKKDIKKECLAHRTSAQFETRESVTETEAMKSDTLGIWCEDCQQITIHHLTGRNSSGERNYKCKNCDKTKTLNFGG